MKKLLFFIASEKGFVTLKTAIEAGKRGNIGCVVTLHEVDVVKDWSEEIVQLCQSNNIPNFFWKEAKLQLTEILYKYSITGAIAISWKYLLPLEINNALEDNLIVFHDSLLPRYRGFAPTPTAIMCGEDEIGVTALFATDEVDKGNIILQRSIKVPLDLYIKDIISMQSALCAKMVVTVIDQMERGELCSTPQDEKRATYSIWRNVEDCQINWKNSATEVYNFVRAVGTPYPGAFSFYEGKKIIVQRTRLTEDDFFFEKRDCGKIWSIENNCPKIVCGKGMLQITSANFEDGHPVEFNYVRRRLG